VGLGMANLVFSKDAGKVGFVADLMFGSRAEETNYYYGGSSAFLKQLYITYKPTDKLKFTAGNFMTFVGYELVEAANNLNYSMSYNYTNGPFFHTGLKMEYAFTDKLSAMLGVFNQTDTKGRANLLDQSLDIGKKFVGGQLAYANGGFKIYLNGLTGKTGDTTQVSTLDVTTSYQVTDRFGIGLNVIDQMLTKEGKTDSWLGTALYLNYAFSPKFTLAARGELMSDKEGLKYGEKDNTITAFTLSGNIKIDAFTLIPEIRLDSASKEIWENDLGKGQKSEAAFILAAVYKF
jgi:hypothetical protein